MMFIAPANYKHTARFCNKSTVCLFGQIALLWINAKVKPY
jgi:hypothetical protein